MIDSGFFLAVAGLGVSIAGFAALMFSFRKGEVGRVTGWRIRYIVTGSFTLTAISLGVVAVALLADDADLQVRLATVLGVVSPLPNLWTYRSLGDPEIFRTRTEAVAWVIGGAAIEVAFLVNLFIASYGVIVVMWVVMVASAMSLFGREVTDLYTPPGRHAAGSGDRG